MKKNLIFLFLIISSFLSAQCSEIESDTIGKTYAVQIFSTVCEHKAYNQASTVLHETIIEVAKVKDKTYYRALVLVENLEKAKEAQEMYKETYADCFIIIYKNGKRIN